MKELPKPIAALFLLLGLALIAIVLHGLTRQGGLSPQSPYLDEVNIETDNPQRAGKNITP